MLLQREKQLLQILYEKKSRFTSTELAATLHSCSRTIKLDIKHLKNELKDTGCLLHTKTGQGIWLTCDEKGKEFLERLISCYALSPSNDPSIRKYHIALQLLESNTYISMESIAKSLYISKGTAVNDMNELTPFFEKYHLTVERKAKYGTCIKGQESQRRFAWSYLLQKLLPGDETGYLQTLQDFFPSISINSIQYILKDCEKQFGLTLADTSYREWLTMIPIMIKRIQQGRFCEYPKEKSHGYTSKLDTHICRYLVLRLEDTFLLTISEDEAYYLYTLLESARTLHFIGLHKEYAVKSALPPAIKDTWDYILNKACMMFNQNRFEDEALKYAMYTHLYSMGKRLHHQIPFHNPIRHMVKENMSYELEMATFIAHLAEEEFHIVLGEDETCDIAVYLAAFREKMRKQQTHGCLIVCGSGMGTSCFLTARLNRIFPDLKIKDILPLSRALTELGPHIHDTVLTTVPFFLEGLDIIKISPVLTDSDIRLIGRHLYTNMVEHPACDSPYSDITCLMDEKISIFHCDCCTKEEVIRFLGSRMISAGYATEGFIECVLKREAIAPTSIGRLFAIPHPFEGYVKKTGIGLMTLKKPIVWGEETVQIILMLSTNLLAQEKFHQIFSCLADLMEDSKTVSRILAANHLNDIRHICSL